MQTTINVLIFMTLMSWISWHICLEFHDINVLNFMTYMSWISWHICLEFHDINVSKFMTQNTSNLSHGINRQHYAIVCLEASQCNSNIDFMLHISDHLGTRYSKDSRLTGSGKQRANRSTDYVTSKFLNKTPYLQPQRVHSQLHTTKCSGKHETWKHFPLISFRGQ